MSVIIRKKKNLTGPQNFFFSALPGSSGELRKELTAFSPAIKFDETPFGCGAVLEIKDALYLLYRSYLMNRALLVLDTREVVTQEELYAFAKSLPWENHLRPQNTFSLRVSGKHAAFSNSLYMIQKFKDGVCDRFRDQTGQRPSIDTENPDVTFHLFCVRNRVQVSLDFGGGPLHERGYRGGALEAPLKETLGAWIVAESGFFAQPPSAASGILDPFCGTGTLVWEAFLRTIRAPTRLFKKDPLLMNWVSRNDEEFREVHERVQNEWVSWATTQNLKTLPRFILCDEDPRALEKVQSIRNRILVKLREFRLEHLMDLVFTVEARPFFRLRPADFAAAQVAITQLKIVANLPFGIRLQDQAQVRELYRGVGDQLKKEFKGCTAALLAGSLELSKEFGLKAKTKIAMTNGGIDCRLCVIPVY